MQARWQCRGRACEVSNVFNYEESSLTCSVRMCEDRQNLLLVEASTDIQTYAIICE